MVEYDRESAFRFASFFSRLGFRPGRDPPTAKQSSLILQQDQDSLKKNECKKSRGANSSYNIGNSRAYSNNTGKHEHKLIRQLLQLVRKDGALSTVKTKGSSQTSKQGTSNIIYVTSNSRHTLNIRQATAASVGMLPTAQQTYKKHQ
jgi:hypothetical protein